MLPTVIAGVNYENKTRLRSRPLLAKSPSKASRSLDECDSSHDRMPHETRVHPSSDGETSGRKPRNLDGEYAGSCRNGRRPVVLPVAGKATVHSEKKEKRKNPREARSRMQVATYESRKRLGN